MKFSLPVRWLVDSLAAPFRLPGGINRPLLLLYLCINGLVMGNAILHAPNIQYDAEGHFHYIETLAQARLPTREDSKEFFSPPLPYLVPALILQSTEASLWAATKTGQLLNVVLSLGLTFTLLKFCDLLHPKDGGLKLAALGMLGILPVFYKTFAFVRGEPFVAFFTTLVVYLALRLFLPTPEGMAPSTRQRNWLILWLGLCLGLGVLSRQWGFFLFPALGFFVLLQKLHTNWAYWRSWVGTLLVSFIVAFLIGGWFYLSLLGRYGTVAAFNRAPQAGFAFSNQPLEFYTGLGLDQLFAHPVRSAFNNQFFPIFYSELWGDYWGYFIIVGRDTRTNELLDGSRQEPRWTQTPVPPWFESNYPEVAAYLGRVNLVSLLPSLLLIASLGMGMIHLGRFFRETSPTLAGNALITLVLLTTLAGYFWFLIRYPNPGKGDTIKASYMLHIFPLLALLAGQILRRIQIASPRWGFGLILLLGAVVLHNLPVMMTRCIP